MPYSKQTWSDNNPTYPLSAARMGVIEQGIYDTAAVADQGHRILSTSAKNALTGVVTGTMVYDSTLNQLQAYNGTKWVPVGSMNVPPMVQVVRTTAFTPVSGTAITWSSSVYDTDTMFTSGTNITINTTGIYSVMFRGYLSATTLTAPIAIIAVGGTDIMQQYLPTVGPNAIFCVSGQIALTAAQVVTAQCNFSGTGPYSLAGAASDSSQRTTFALTYLGRSS